MTMRSRSLPPPGHHSLQMAYTDPTGGILLQGPCFFTFSLCQDGVSQYSSLTICHAPYQTPRHPFSAPAQILGKLPGAAAQLRASVYTQRAPPLHLDSHRACSGGSSKGKASIPHLHLQDGSQQRVMYSMNESEQHGTHSRHSENTASFLSL